MKRVNPVCNIRQKSTKHHLLSTHLEITFRTHSMKFLPKLSDSLVRNVVATFIHKFSLISACLYIERKSN